MLLSLLLSCAAPESDWPGLLLLDRGARDAGVVYRDGGPPLQLAEEAMVLVGGRPSDIDADDGELAWVTVDAGGVVVDRLEVGVDVDPDEVIAFTEGAVAPLADLDGIEAEATGMREWTLRGPDALLLLASEAEDLTDALPVLVPTEDPVAGAASDRAGARGAVRSSPGAGRANGRDAGGDGTVDGADGIDGTQAGWAGENPYANPDTDLDRFGDTASAAFVGLHEGEGMSLVLAADGSWRAGFDEDAPRGTWALSTEGDVLLMHGPDSVALPTDGDEILLTLLPF